METKERSNNLNLELQRMEHRDPNYKKCEKKLRDTENGMKINTNSCKQLKIFRINGRH